MDFNPQSYAPDGTAIFANDAQLLVKFFNHPQISKFKSDKAGLPMYDDVEMISVIQPGEKEEIKVLATEFHRRRFPKQYEAFQKGLEQTAGGTPLDHLFPSEPSTIANLKAFNIYTVQQLAAITDVATKLQQHTDPLAAAVVANTDQTGGTGGQTQPGGTGGQTQPAGG